MAEFNLVSIAQYSPTWCAGCMSHGGPFIDTNLEHMQIATAQGVMHFDGHVYFCVLCARQMGVLAGCADPAVAAQMDEREVDLRLQIEALQQELVAARDNKIVNRVDFREWLGTQINAVSTEEVPTPPKRGPGRPRKNPSA